MSGDNADAYYHETFSAVLDGLLQDLKGELDAAVRAALNADRPPSPDEGYEAAKAEPATPFGYAKDGTRWNKPTSLMTRDERLAHGRWRLDQDPGRAAARPAQAAKPAAPEQVPQPTPPVKLVHDHADAPEVARVVPLLTTTLTAEELEADARRAKALKARAARAGGGSAKAE